MHLDLVQIKKQLSSESEDSSFPFSGCVSCIKRTIGEPFCHSSNAYIYMQDLWWGALELNDSGTGYLLFSASLAVP